MTPPPAPGRPGPAEAQPGVAAPPGAAGGLLGPDALAFLALVALPVLAFVCAVLGLILVVQGRTAAGLVFLLVLTQAFAIGGFILWNRRKRARAGR